MNNKWFSKEIYKETLREGRSWALIAALILGLEAILIPIGQVINYINIDYAGGVKETVDLMSMHPLVVLSFTMIAPLLTIYLFRFLNRRDASDFYHALPYTRSCMFVSRIAAAYTLSYAVMWGTSAIGILLHMIFSQYYQILYADTFMLLLRFSVCTFLVVAAVSISVSVTGNLIANLAVALMIIFGPRVLMLAMSFSVTSNLSVVNYDQITGIFGNNWNQVTGIMFGLFLGFDEALESIRPIIYTMILGVIYLILGCRFFKIRKSEAAQQAAASPKLQLVFRTIPAVIFCMIPNIMVYEHLTQRDLPDAITIYNWLVLYLVGIIIYFAYELVSSGRIRNLKRAVPGVLFLLGANVCVILGMLGLRTSILSFKPSPEKISAVKFVGNGFYRYDGYGTNGDLLADITKTLEIDDPVIREMISKRLEQSVAFDVDRDYHYIKIQDMNGAEVVQNFDMQRTVAIRTGAGWKYRNIYFLPSDLELISQKLSTEPGVKESFMKLPDLDNGTVWLTMQADRDGLNYDLSPVYEAYREDIKDMGFEEWYSYYMNECYYGNTGDSYGNLIVIKEQGKKVQSAYLRISDKTPKAKKAFVESYTKVREEAIEAITTGLQKILDHPEEYEIESMDCWHSNYTTGEDSYYNGDPESIRQIYELFEGQKGKKLTLSENTDVVNLYLFAYKRSEYEQLKDDDVIDLSYTVYLEP